MPLVHLVDLSIVCGTVAVADVLHEQASELVRRGRPALLQRVASGAVLAAARAGRTVRTGLRVLLLQLLLRHFFYEQFFF